MNNLQSYVPDYLEVPFNPLVTHVSKFPHYVYILEIPYKNTLIYKVGISTNVINRVKGLSSVEKPSSEVRGKNIKLGYITIIAKAWFPCKDSAFNYEQFIIEYYKEYKYTSESLLANGNTELFTENIFKLIQQDFKR